MRPALSIFAALVITILLIVVIPYSGILNFFIFILGGGIVIWVSTENKVKYSLYYGIISLVIFGFFLDNLIIVIIPIFAGIGGVIAKKIRVRDDKKLIG